MLIEASGGVAENEITFGGSLLGRLINSIVRKAKIQYNYKKVSDISSKIESELNALITEGLPQDVKQNVINYSIKYLIP
jgi:hypothetical protein